MLRRMYVFTSSLLIYKKWNFKETYINSQLQKAPTKANFQQTYKRVKWSEVAIGLTKQIRRQENKTQEGAGWPEQKVYRVEGGIADMWGKIKEIS